MGYVLTLNGTTICGIIGRTNHRLSNRSIAVPSNAAPIVQQIQQDFQALIAYSTGLEAQTQTAYRVELTLFRRVTQRVPGAGSRPVAAVFCHAGRCAPHGPDSGGWHRAGLSRPAHDHL